MAKIEKIIVDIETTTATENFETGEKEFYKHLMPDIVAFKQAKNIYIVNRCARLFVQVVENDDKAEIKYKRTNYKLERVEENNGNYKACFKAVK